MSPDRRHFFIVTRRGNVEARTNTFEIRLYLARDAMDAGAKGARATAIPERIIAARTVSHHGAGIRSAQWTQDGAIAYLAEGPADSLQVFQTTVDGVSSMLTNDPRGVASFGIGPRGVIYSVPILPDWTERNRDGYVWTSENAKYMAVRQPGNELARYVTFVHQSNRGVPKSVQLAETSVSPRYWMSPSGDFAIALVPADGAPQDWIARYNPERLRNSSAIGAQERTADNPAFGRQGSIFWQFVLIDLSNGTTHPLTDAPSAYGITSVVGDVVWARDGRSAMIVNTFIAGQQPWTAVAGFAEVPWIAELSLTDRTIRPVAQLPPTSGFWSGRRNLLIGFRMDGSDCFELRYDRGVSAPELEASTYVRRQRTWEQRPDATCGGDAGPNIRVVQSLNTPPDLAIFEAETLRQTVVTNLNPQIVARTIPQVTLYSWRDRHGAAMMSGLVRPPDFRAGHRYPLVVQTYGFNEDEFLSEGPDGKTSAFAARALAARGMLVLQLGVNYVGYLGPGEGPANSEMFEDAISSLVREGLVDPARVGIIGFSRTGMHVHHALTFGEFEFAAATIADSFSVTPFSYVLRFGEPYPGMAYWEQQVGAAPWGEGYARWLERSPALNLDRLRTPLRIELYGSGLSDYWDTFAILTRQRRPVELFHLPGAPHVVASPSAMLASEQGNVDWFAFWLTGYEDPDPAKAQQYERWRRLRGLRDAGSREPRPPRRHWRVTAVPERAE